MLARGEKVAAIVLAVDGPTKEDLHAMVVELTTDGALLLVIDDAQHELSLAKPADLVLDGNQEVGRLVDSIHRALTLPDSRPDSTSAHRTSTAPGTTEPHAKHARPRRSWAKKRPEHPLDNAAQTDQALSQWAQKRAAKVVKAPLETPRPTREPAQETRERLELAPIKATRAVRTQFPVLAISASTGGTQLIAGILRRTVLTDRFCYIVVQHGPTWMLESYAQRLDQALPISVKLAEHGEHPRAGVMYIAPGDHHLSVVANPSLSFQLHSTAKVNYVRPAIDVTFTSVAEVFGAHCIGVVLTGMGKDGAAGCVDISNAGGRVFVQSPDTAIAPSMPRAALDAVPAAQSINPVKIPDMLTLAMNQVYKLGWPNSTSRLTG
ncbi:MAG: two-component system chemotaxis response regulator CheB [Kiritimatiellia bacterium]|jgi:two-component system chemotaxis response regulator CheB